ncbi:MAG: NRDE family protein [Deltaproteobacteria bacterium]|nr:NRDE family protein [Deltaproteobacteria bacterium]MBW1910066.1 NRDE family protein [Deltaproteobacteria bacterium]MBW2032952.1 NRDE family protein [Deltaproteobacteria bacterium]MBW2114888.1 NRDE family protein [Deltaproteobacteria bacterium]
MCLILLALRSHPAYKLIITANRDEYYERPTAAAAFRAEIPDVLAGKDLRAGGTWLGITRKGRIAAITNYRDPASVKSGSPSRGKLVSDYLSGRESPVNFLDVLGKNAGQYNGFNLIVGERDDLYWYSNRGEGTHNLAPGIYGLSNHLLDTPWPKVIRGKEALERLLYNEKDPAPDAFFRILADRTIPHDEHLPDTGVGLEWERILSPIFITSPTYGTRSSTLIMIDMNDRVTFIERTFNSDPDHATTVKYEFQIENT